MYCIPGHTPTPHQLSSGCDVKVNHLLQWPSFDTQAKDGASLYLNRTNRLNCIYVNTQTHTEFLLWNPTSGSLNSMSTNSICSEGLEPGSWKQKANKVICKLCCNPWFCLFLIHVYVFLYIFHLVFFGLAFCRDFTTALSCENMETLFTQKAVCWSQCKWL